MICDIAIVFSYGCVIFCLIKITSEIDRVDKTLKLHWEILKEIEKNNYKFDSFNPISHIQSELDQLRKVTNHMANSHEEFTHRLRNFFDEVQRRKG